jgi:hypothetical protein
MDTDFLGTEKLNRRGAEETEGERGKQGSKAGEGEDRDGGGRKGKLKFKF